MNWGYSNYGTNPPLAGNLRSDCISEFIVKHSSWVENKISGGIATKHRDEAGDDLMCAVLETLPSQAIISLVNCTTIYESTVVCVQPDEKRQVLEDTYKQQKHRRMLYSGFTIQRSGNSSQLVESVCNCPKGYIYFLDHSCIKIVPFTKKLPSYASCIYHSNLLVKGCRGNRKALDAFGSVCKADNATILSKKYKHIPDPEIFQAVMKDLMPMDYFAVRGHTSPACAVCEPYPRKHVPHNVMFIDTPDINTEIPHFIICSKDVDNSSTESMLDEFQSYNCAWHTFDCCCSCV